MPSPSDPIEWRALPERTPAESRRLRKRLVAIAFAYVLWSAACLGLSSVQSAWEPPLVGVAALLFAGGPPLLLSTVPGLWSIYVVLSLVVGALGGGAVMAWRRSVTLSVVLWAGTLVAWWSTILVIIAAGI